ncbi:MAG: ribonuclease H-like domain-containing protein [Clostridia bacterium]
METGGVGSYWARRVLGTPEPEVPAREPQRSADTPQRAAELLSLLLDRHTGRALSDVYPLTMVDTPEGPAPAIVTVRDITPPAVDAARAEDHLRGALELVFGIGPIYAERFRQAGLSRLDQLVEHPVYGPRARAVLDLIGRDPGRASALIRERMSPSHPLLWWTTALYPSSSILFVDIETMGFFGVAVILIGLAEWIGDRLHITQYVARNVSEEPQILAAFAAHAAGKPVLVSYNGRSFDWPTLEARASYYGIPLQHPGWPHYDLLHFARRCWRENLPDFHATTVEREILGVVREDDLPGSYVPAFYEQYSQENNVGPLCYIVDHNRQDMEGMARIFTRLTEEWTLRVG